MRNQVRLQLYADHLKGMSYAELAIKYECNRTTVRDVIRNKEAAKARREEARKRRKHHVSINKSCG